MSGGKTKVASVGSETERPNVNQDRLEYMADMLLELRDMAQKEGCKTLVALLDLSHSEARIQARSSRI